MSRGILLSTKYIKIDGIFCDHCRETITNELQIIENISFCKIYGDIAKIYIDGEQEETINRCIEIINNLGYRTDRKHISDHNKWQYTRIISIAAIMTIVLFIRFVINKYLGYDIVNVIPEITTTLSLGAIFVTGLLTSAHCVGMCGAINLVASSNKINAVFYNVSRVFSYTVTGFLVGCIGSTLSFDDTILNLFSLLVAVLMLLIGVGMAGLLTLPSWCNFGTKVNTSNAFILGFINGFMPCGPLVAMQLYALSLASPFKGALSMLLFGLGTTPLMLGFGLLRNILEKYKATVQKVMSAFIILLAIYMIIRSLSALGINISNNNLDQYVIATIKDNAQVVQVDLTYSSYADIAVKKDIPVKFIINSNDQITGCNNEVVCKELGFDEKIVEGQTIIKFFPSKTGYYTYTCWMNMIKNTIYVYE